MNDPDVWMWVWRVAVLIVLLSISGNLQLLREQRRRL